MNPDNPQFSIEEVKFLREMFEFERDKLPARKVYYVSANCPEYTMFQELEKRNIVHSNVDLLNDMSETFVFSITHFGKELLVKFGVHPVCTCCGRPLFLDECPICKKIVCNLCLEPNPFTEVTDKCCDRCKKFMITFYERMCSHG